MKRYLLILLLLLPVSIFAEVTIDKDNCTIIKDGKTFPLYGNIQIVDSYPDIEVKIVDSYPDIEVKIVDSYANDCGEIKIVDSYPVVRVKIVDSYPDIEVKIVDSYPGIR